MGKVDCRWMEMGDGMDGRERVMTKGGWELCRVNGQLGLEMIDLVVAKGDLRQTLKGPQDRNKSEQKVELIPPPFV